MNEILRDIGLTDGEIMVYKTLLQLGPSQTGEIIKKSGLQSSAVYHILDTLIDKGLVSYQIKNNKKCFFASDPKQLVTLVEEKKNKLADEKNKLLALLPQFIALKNIDTKKNQEIKIFEGWNGVLSAFKESYSLLKPGTTVYAYTLTREYGGADTKQVRWLINKIREERTLMNKKLKQKIVMKLIAEKHSEIGIDQSKTPFTHVKFIDKNHTNPAVINIYGECSVIVLWLKTPIAIFIKSKEAADSFRNNFMLIWNNL